MAVILIFLPFLLQDADPAERLEKAIALSREKGGRVIRGEVKRDSTVKSLGRETPGLGGSSVEGEFTAEVGANGTTRLVLDREKERLEIFRRADRIVHRQTWAEEDQPRAGSFPNEASTLLQLERFSKPEKTSKGGESEVDGRTCDVVEAAYPVTLLEKKPEGEDLPPIRVLAVKSVDVRFHIDREDGVLRRMEVEVVRGYSKRMGGRPRERGDDPTGFRLTDIRFEARYTFTVETYDPELKVAIPEDLARFFEE